MAGFSLNRLYMTDDEPPDVPYILSSSDESLSDEAEVADVAEEVFAEEIYKSVIAGRSSSFNIIFQEWLAIYENNKMVGVAVLLQFLFRCCEARLSFHEMSDILEKPQLMRTSLPQATWLSTKYVLVNTKYSSNLVNFMGNLWRYMPEEVVFDDVEFDKMVHVLGKLCESKLQAVRHTAVVAVTSLIHNIAKYRASVLQEKENKSSRGEAVHMNKRRMKKLNSFMNVFFKIFEHSRRDVVYQIRTVSLEAMREVMKSSPTSYFGKIASFGPSLGDQAVSVRLLALKCLVSFLDLHEVTNVLVQFIADHKEQIQSLINGASKTAALRDATQECIVRLIVFLHSHNRDQIQIEDINLMLYWISLDNKKAARIAGNFILNFQNEDEAIGIFGERKRELLNLLDFFTRAKITNFSPYMKNLLNLVPALQDWAFMYNLLLESCREAGSDGLSALLLSSIKYNEQISSVMERKRMTLYFLPRLHEMLAKFSADSEQTANLTMIPVYFVFSDRVSDKVEKDVKNLLRILLGLVKKVSNIEVFGSCIQAITSFSAMRPFQQDANETLLEVNKELTLRFHPEELLSPDPDLDDFLQVAKKVERFLCFSTIDSILNACGYTLTRIKDQDYVIQRCGSVMLSIVWLCVAHTFRVLMDHFDPLAAERLQNYTRLLVTMCGNFMMRFKEVAEKAFSVLCHVMQCFCEGMKKKDIRLQQLVYVADRRMVIGINSWIEDTLFKANLENGENDDAERNNKFLKQYLGLVDANCIKMDYAGTVLRYMYKGDAQYGTTFKEFLLKQKSADRLIIATVFHSALIGAGLYLKKRIWTLVDVQDLGNHLFKFVHDPTVANREIVKGLHASAMRFTIHCLRDGFFEFFLLEQMALFPLEVDEDRLHVLQMATREFVKLSQDMRDSPPVRKYLNMLEGPGNKPDGANSETNSPVSKKQKGARTRSTRSRMARKRLDFT